MKYIFNFIFIVSFLLASASMVLAQTEDEILDSVYYKDKPTYSYDYKNSDPVWEANRALKDINRSVHEADRRAEEKDRERFRKNLRESFSCRMSECYDRSVYWSFDDLYAHYGRMHIRGFGNGYASTAGRALDSILNYLISKKEIETRERERARLIEAIKQVELEKANLANGGRPLERRRQTSSQTEDRGSNASSSAGEEAETETMPSVRYTADREALRTTKVKILGIVIYSKDGAVTQKIGFIPVGGSWNRIGGKYRNIVFKAIVNNGGEEREVELKIVESDDGFKLQLP